MTILSEKETGMGGKWALVDCGNNFYAYGVEQDLHTLLGFPVDQCGTREEVLTHCKSISKLCNQNIEKYQRELAKDKKNFDEWENLIEHEKKELEMLIKFAKVLSAINDGFMENMAYEQYMKHSRNHRKDRYYQKCSGYFGKSLKKLEEEEKEKKVKFYIINHTCR